MRQILVNYYLLIYRILGFKSYSYWVTLLWITILCVVCLNGLQVMGNEMAAFKALKIAFTFPYVLIIGGLIYYRLTKLAPYKEIVYKVAKDRGVSFYPIFISLVLTFVSWLYAYAISIKFFET